MRRVLCVLVLLAAVDSAEGFSAPLGVHVSVRSLSAVVRRAPQLCTPSLAPSRIVLRSLDIKVEGTTETDEECEGPAKDGEVGNIDMSAAKVTADEIKTDGIINLSPSAIAQVTQLRKSRGGAELVMRVGVRSGGCSGMSYVMEFEDASKVDENSDSEIKFDGFKVVVDPKSLMFVYGMTLDYSDALIGGGFKFSNPNADTTCGCGQSFGA